jgi:hypothetical protein
MSTLKITIIVSAIVAVIVGLIATPVVWFFVISNPTRGTIDFATMDFQQSLALDATLSRSQARRDLNYVRDTISRKHFSAIGGLTPEFSAAYDREIAALSNQNTVLCVWRATSRMLHTLNDGHSYIRPILPGLYEHGVNIEVDDDGNIMIERHKGEFFPLRKINGVCIEEFAANAEKHFSCENVYCYYSCLENSFFAAEYLAMAGLEYKTDRIEFTYYRDGLNEFGVAYEWVPSRGLGTLNPDRTDFIRSNFEPEKSRATLILTNYIDNDHYKDYLKGFFTRVQNQNIETVVFDLTRNGGGHVSGVFEKMKYIDVAQYDSYGLFARWAFMQMDMTDLLVMEADAGISFNGRVTNNRYDEAFGGEIIVLTSRVTFSASVMFATILYDNDNINATIVGQPVTNSPTNFSGALLHQLPVSRLMFATTFMYLVRPDAENTDTTLMPARREL